MELMQCFEQGCKNEVEYSCPCTSPETLSCELHALKHMKIPNRAHVCNSIFLEPYQGTKEEILKFLTRESSKNSKLREKILASFSKRLLESKNDIERLLKHLDSGSAEISNYFTKISQAQKLSKSEQDPILGLLTLQPENKKSERELKDWKEEIMLKTKNEINLLNSQIITLLKILPKSMKQKKPKSIKS